MAMKKKPVTGMKDILPREMEIRDYAIGLIKDTYKTYGFTSVETPAVEHIENLLRHTPVQRAHLRRCNPRPGLLCVSGIPARVTAAGRQSVRKFRRI